MSKVHIFSQLTGRVVYGRVAGRSAARFFNVQNIKYIESMKSGSAAAAKL